MMDNENSDQTGSLIALEEGKNNDNNLNVGTQDSIWKRIWDEVK